MKNTFTFTTGQKCSGVESIDNSNKIKAFMIIINTVLKHLRFVIFILWELSTNDHLYQKVKDSENVPKKVCFMSPGCMKCCGTSLN